MTGALLLLILLSAYNGVYGVFHGGEEVLPLCVLAGGLTGILTERLQESTEVGEAVSTNTDTNTDPCAGNDCGGQGECLASFCNCSSGFCGPNCEKSDQVTGQACPCEIRFSLCVENTCVCECGFTFDQAVNLCKKDCPKGFADTFTVFDGFFLPERTTLDEFSSLTLEELRTECNDACLQNQACRAYAIDIFRVECILFSVSKDDIGLMVDNDYETFERDCIDEIS